MATNKHATIRYLALDKCFSNFRRKFYIEDLIAECNKALYEFSGIKDGVKRRQLFDDITFMESDQGWSVPLERVREGRRVFYRYSDPSFSIKNQGINDSEMEQVNETLIILSRFKGLPNFEWIEELQLRLVDTFKLQGEMKAVVGFEQNPYLKGLHYFTELFDAINHQRTLQIEYQGYRQEAPVSIVISPWYLKQFNNRWFLFGYNTGLNRLTNFALDRIKLITPSNMPFTENTEIDFEEFFDDVVGVTILEDKEVETVVLRVNKNTWPYIQSKPLHGSQKLIKDEGDFVDIQLNVIPNYELVSLLFSYLDAIEVVQPPDLRKRFQDIAQKIFLTHQ